MSRPRTSERPATPGAAHAAVGVHWESPTGVGGIALARLHAGSPAALDAFLCALTGQPAPRVGSIVRRAFAGLDDGLVARSTPMDAWVMPHGGPGICAALRHWMAANGAHTDPIRTAAQAFPEARDETEAAALELLCRAASPRALPLLLRSGACLVADETTCPAAPQVLARTRRLMHLIDPPCVVAVGAPNVGKSSLLNALAGRCVAIAFDAAGTTRDAVAAQLLLDGLVVDWFDTPGIRQGQDPVERAAQDLAHELHGRADLLVEISAPGVPCPPVACSAPRLRVCTHVDTDPARQAPESRAADVCVSSPGRTGLDSLACALRAALVHDDDLASGDPLLVQPAAPAPKPLGTPTQQ